MSPSEKKYGKVLSIRLRPENAWIIAEIEKDASAEQEGKKVFSGKSRVVETILVHHYEQKRKKEAKVY